MTRPDPQPHTAYLLTALGHEVIDNARDEVTFCQLSILGWLVIEGGATWAADAYRAMKEDEQCRLDESLS